MNDNVIWRYPVREYIGTDQQARVKRQTGRGKLEKTDTKLDDGCGAGKD